MSAWTLRAALLALITVTLTACGTATPETTAETPAGPPANGGTYETGELIADVITCTGYRALTSPDAAPGTGSCTDDNGELVMIRIYSSASDLATEKDAFETAPFFKNKSMLVGENWTLVAGDAYATQAQKQLGGELIASAD